LGQLNFGRALNAPGFSLRASPREALRIQQTCGIAAVAGGVSKRCDEGQCGERKIVTDRP
jgi:hypothetical protein